MNSFRKHIYRENKVISESNPDSTLSATYNINPTGISNLSNFCAIDASSVVYMQRSFNSNTVGDTVYQDGDKTITFNGNGDYFAMTSPRETGLVQFRSIIVTGDYVFGKIDSNGIITDYTESSITGCTDKILFDQRYFTQDSNTNQVALDEIEDYTYYINPGAFQSDGSILNNAQVYKNATLTSLYDPKSSSSSNYQSSDGSNTGRQWVSCQTTQGGSLRYFSLKLNTNGVVIGYSL